MHRISGAQVRIRFDDFVDVKLGFVFRKGVFDGFFLIEAFVAVFRVSLAEELISRPFFEIGSDFTLLLRKRGVDEFWDFESALELGRDVQETRHVDEARPV